MPPRPPKTRTVGFLPVVTYFKPAGVPMADLTEVQLGVDELEALRLKDVVGLDQEECAERMNLTQSTFQRILAAARQKVSKAIVEGRVLRVEGGNYQFVQRWLCRSCSSVFEAAVPPEGEGGMTCPSCEGNQLDNLSSRGSGWGRPPWAGAGRGRRRGGRG